MEPCTIPNKVVNVYNTLENPSMCSAWNMYYVCAGFNDNIGVWPSLLLADNLMEMK
jgi:hypothetical protein